MSDKADEAKMGVRVLVQVLTALVLMAAFAGIYKFLEANKEETKQVKPERVDPLVEVITARTDRIHLTITAQGNVRAHTQTRLVPEVSGRVVAVHEAFESGRSLAKGQWLLRLERADYAAAEAAAQAQFEMARLDLLQEEALGRQAREDWKELGQGQADPLVLREPQIVAAKARFQSAEAALRKASRDLERTELRMPYAGRVLSRKVSLGDYLAGPSALVGEIFATDYVEIEVPLSDRDFALLKDGLGSEAVVRADFGKREQRWEGRLDRASAVMDPQTRMLSVIVRVDDPYGGQVPLRVGEFVEVDLQGQVLERAVRLPRRALAGASSVYVVDAEGRIHEREVEIIQADSKEIVIGAGLEDGEQVSLTKLSLVVDGMAVRTEATEQP